MARTGGIGVGLLTVAAGCNALFGIGDLRFEPLGEGGDGAGGESAGEGGFGVGGTPAGGQGGEAPMGCPMSDCDACTESDCATSACSSVLATCAQSPDCVAALDCYRSCGSDIACEQSCGVQQVSKDPALEALSCLRCDATSCATSCAAECVTCDQGVSDCQNCVNTSCALMRCDAAVTACLTSTPCTDLMNCAGTCADEACVQDCVNQFPTGYDPYVELFACLICTPQTCYSICASGGYQCG